MYKTGMSLLVCGLFLSFPSFVAAKSHLNSKAEFFMRKVPNGHDFTKIAENARYRPGHLLVRFAAQADGKNRNISEKKNILKNLGGAKIKRNYKKTPD